MTPHRRPRGRGAASGLTSAAAVVLAFVASQHHNVHMVLIALGVGGAGSTFMQTYPWVRRLMLLISVGVVAMNLAGLRLRPLSRRTRGWVLLFSALTVAIVVWSLVRFGL